MALLPAHILSTFRSELKKLEDREAALKRELAEITSAANYLRKVIRGAEKNENSDSK